MVGFSLPFVRLRLKIHYGWPTLAPSVPGQVTNENQMEIPELAMFSADTDSFHQFF